MPRDPDIGHRDVRAPHTEDGVATWRRGTTEVRWHGGAVVVAHPGGVILVGAPLDAVAALGDDASRLSTLVLPTDRTRDLAGVVALLDAVGRARGGPQPLHVLLGADAERGGALASAWTRGWADVLRLDVDAVMPGGVVDAAGGATVEAVPLALGEARHGAVRRVSGGGLRLTVGAATVAVVPAARPGPQLARLCHGADLAVIEVGVTPWPASDAPWRPTLSDAARAAEGAAEAWLVGDDARWLGDEDAQ